MRPAPITQLPWKQEGLYTLRALMHTFEYKSRSTPSSLPFGRGGGLVTKVWKATFRLFGQREKLTHPENGTLIRTPLNGWSWLVYVQHRPFRAVRVRRALNLLCDFFPLALFDARSRIS